MNTPNLKNKASRFSKSTEKAIAKLLFWLMLPIFWFFHKLLSCMEFFVYKKDSERAEKSNKELCFDAKKNGVFLTRFLIIIGVIITFSLIGYEGINIPVLVPIIIIILTVICMLIQYFRNQNLTRHFQLSRGHIFVNTYSLHLSMYLIGKLKNIKEKGEASKLLHNDYYQSPYLEVLDYAFGELNAKVVTRQTHHLGKKKVRNAAEKLLKDKGYEFKFKEVRPLFSVAIRGLLCFELNKMKPSDFDNFHIYQCTITKRAVR